MAEKIVLQRTSRIRWTEQLTDANFRLAFLNTLQRILPIIAEEATRLCPVRSGDLKATIKWEIDEAGLIGYVTAGGTRKVFYAHMPEFGTIKMGAQPYMRPALDKHRRSAIAIYKEEIVRVLSA